MRIVAVAAVVADLLFGSWVRPAAAATGLTYLKPRATVPGPTGARLWDLGRNPDKSAFPGPLATLAEVGRPGCEEGPCGVALVVSFYGGGTLFGSAVQPILQVAQASTTTFLILTGFCYLACSVALSQVDAPIGHGTWHLLLTKSQIPLKTAECGLLASRNDRYFTVVATPKPKQPYFDSLKVIAGAHTCQ